MKMKSILLMMLSLCMLVCLCACGDDTPDTNKKDETPSTSTTVLGSADPTDPSQPNVDPTVPSDDDPINPTESTNNGPTVAPTQGQPTQPVDGKANYTVIVTDEAGNPIPGAFVQLCLESCIPCMTNAQGVASYPNMAVADYKVSFITVPGGYQLPTDNFYFEKDSYEMTLVLKAAN